MVVHRDLTVEHRDDTIRNVMFDGIKAFKHQTWSIQWDLMDIREDTAHHGIHNYISI